MPLDLAALRTLAWRTFDCAFCGEVAGHRCVTSSGARTTPHVARLALAQGWDARQSEVDELQRGIDQRDTVITADQDALRTAAENAATLTDQLKTARLGAALVPGLQQQIADLLAKIAELSAPPTPPPAPKPGPTLGAQFHAVWTRYGNTFGATHVDVLTKLKAAGVRLVRVDTSWQAWEPTKGGLVAPTKLYGGKLGGTLDWCKANGMCALVTIFESPSWAAGAARRLPDDPASMAGIGKYATEQLAAWGETIVGVEVWNEPSLSAFDDKGPRPDHYLACLQAFYAAAKAGKGASVPIVFGAPDSIAIQATGSKPSKPRQHFLGYIYDALGSGPFPWDVQAVHCYPGTEADSTADGTETYWRLRHLDTLLARMDTAGDKAPVWITEFGYSAHANTAVAGAAPPSYQVGVTAAQQATLTVGYLDEVEARYADRVPVASLYTDWQAADPSKATTNVARHEAGFGILGPNRETTSPLYAALAAR